jgi:hypothetical protein
MAHSLQTCRGKTSAINDGDLLVIIGFAVELANQSPRFEKIRSLLDDWRAALPMYGPGVIDLNLDQFAQDPEAVRELTELLNLILHTISQDHKKIPAPVLNTELPIKGATGVTFVDYEISFIQKAVERIEALILESSSPAEGG